MTGPRVTIDLEKIERNARTVVAACRAAGIEVFGVTKGTCGMPQVARAMLRGGVLGIGESRFENIGRLRDSGLDCPILLLRSPPLSRIEEVIASVDISLNSELAIIQELSRVAERMARIHEIILMVDLGDLREGIWPDELLPLVETVVGLPGVRIVGLGTNLTCFGAVLPSEENMAALLGHARAIEDRFGLQLRYVSGGNSSSLPLLLSGAMPAGINNLRIGEAILQGGRDTFYDAPWRELEQDAFLLSAELLEVKVKPSMPIGKTGVDAFGRRPVFVDRGKRLRGILNIGREDVDVEGVKAAGPGVEVLGASSDHLVVDLTAMAPAPRVGTRLDFRMSYSALLAAMTSEYVEKQPMLDKPVPDRAKRVGLLIDPAIQGLVAAHELEPRFKALGFDYRSELLPEPADGEAAIAGQAAAVLERGAIPLILGRDHFVTLPGLRALAGRVDAFGLLWFDARAGLRAPAGDRGPEPGETTLYRALGLGGGTTGVTPQLSPENVALIGLRDVAPEEAAIVQGSRMTVFTIADIDALGIREVLRQALDRALAGTRGLYVSYDPAVTDIPGTLTGSGGITLRETHMAMEIIARRAPLLALDAVGLGPDQEARIVAETCGFILSCFGKQIL